MTRLRRRVGMVAVLVAAALTLTACSNGPTTTSGPTGTPTTPTGSPPSQAADGLDWVLTASALSYVAQDPTALAVLEAGHIYELMSKHAQPVAGVNAILTQDFTSYTALSSAIRSGNLVSGVQAVLFDPEDWTLTPLVEQVGASTYIQQAVALAHQHGLKLIATPAFDLVNVTQPNLPKSQVEAAFLATGIEQAAARADIVDIQAQSKERNPASYLSFIEQAETAIDGANPGAVVISGLSTNPSGSQVTCQDLVSSIGVSIGKVAGYWLNVPKQGTACPKCGPNSNPQIGTCALDTYFH